MSFYSMNKILGKLYEKVGAYSRFIKLLENTYGMLPEDLISFLFDEIKKVKIPNTVTIESLYQHIGCYYNREEIIFMILQNIKQVKNKDRRKFITHDEYIDIHKPIDKLSVLKSENSMDLLIKDFDRISIKSLIDMDMDHICKTFNITTSN